MGRLGDEKDDGSGSKYVKRAQRAGRARGGSNGARGQSPGRQDGRRRARCWRWSHLGPVAPGHVWDVSISNYATPSMPGVTHLHHFDQPEEPGSGLGVGGKGQSYPARGGSRPWRERLMVEMDCGAYHGPRCIAEDRSRRTATATATVSISRSRLPQQLAITIWQRLGHLGCNGQLGLK